MRTARAGCNTGEAQQAGAATAALLLSCVTAGAFSRLALGPAWEWSNYDDPVNFLQNPHIHRLSRENLRWMLREGVVVGVYEPVANVFKALQVGSSAASQPRRCLQICTASSCPVFVSEPPPPPRPARPSALWTGGRSFRC